MKGFFGYAQNDDGSVFFSLSPASAGALKIHLFDSLDTSSYPSPRGEGKTASVFKLPLLQERVGEKF